MKTNSDVIISLFVSLVITTLFFALVAPVTATTTVSDSDSDMNAIWPWPPEFWMVWGYRTYAYVIASYEYSTPHGFDEINHTAKVELGTLSPYKIKRAYYIFKAEEVGNTGSYTVYYHTCVNFTGSITISYHKGQVEEGWSYSEAPRHAITQVYAEYNDTRTNTIIYSSAYADVWRNT